MWEASNGAPITRTVLLNQTGYNIGNSSLLECTIAVPDRHAYDHSYALNYELSRRGMSLAHSSSSFESRLDRL